MKETGRCSASCLEPEPSSEWKHRQKKKTLAGGMHTFTQCPTISRNKTEGVEVAQCCSGTETVVSASVMADYTPPRDGCRGTSGWQMCCAAGTQVQTDLMSKGGRAD